MLEIKLKLKQLTQCIIISGNINSCVFPLTKISQIIRVLFLLIGCHRINQNICGFYITMEAAITVQTK